MILEKNVTVKTVSKYRSRSRIQENWMGFVRISSLQLQEHIGKRVKVTVEEIEGVDKERKKKPKKEVKANAMSNQS